MKPIAFDGIGNIVIIFDFDRIENRRDFLAGIDFSGAQRADYGNILETDVPHSGLGFKKQPEFHYFVKITFRSFRFYQMIKKSGEIDKRL